MIVAIEQISFIGWNSLYISLLNQACKGKVFYSVDKYFETGADLRYIFDKQILKHLDAMFFGILLCDSARDFGVEFESSRHRQIFKISQHAVKKL